MARIAAIVPAAGLGTRMGADQPKQFLELDGLPLIIFTLRRLALSPAITDFFISTRAEDVVSLEDKVAKAALGRPARVVHGGDTRQQYVAKNLQMMGAMHRAGVPFLAGTDTAPGIYVLPGFSLHDELAYFVEAGFTPMEALQSATSNPAHFLRKDDSYGAVAPGKAADLVLLSANPLDDIHNTRKISAVVANGRLFERAGLDHILEQVQQAAQNPK